MANKISITMLNIASFRVCIPLKFSYTVGKYFERRSFALSITEDDALQVYGLIISCGHFKLK